MVPEGGLEPPHSQGASDFESDASTSSTTPACVSCIIKAYMALQVLLGFPMTENRFQDTGSDDDISVFLFDLLYGKQ
jgi:hypothetical protein